MTEKITYDEFYRVLQKDRHFAMYAQNVGSYAKYFAHEFWNDKKLYLGPIADAQAKQDKLRQLVQRASTQMTIEQDKLSCVNRQMNGLFGQAQRGALGKKLTLVNNQLAPGTYQANANDDDATKAAKWVKHSSGSLEHLHCPITEHDIVVAIRHISKGGPSFTRHTVDYIRKKVYFGPKQSNLDWGLANLKKLRLRRKPRVVGARFTQAQIDNALNNAGNQIDQYNSNPTIKTRWADNDSVYPGTSCGAYFLYKKVFPKAQTLASQVANQARNAPGAPQHGPTPQDLACFVLGSFLAAHPLRDGNGRTARVLYAGVLLANEEPFVAPSDQIVIGLSGLGAMTPDPNMPPKRNFNFFDTNQA